MQDRLNQELDLLRRYYPTLKYREEGQWVFLPEYPVPSPWKPNSTPICFQILAGHPGTPPYGFYVSRHLKFGEDVPEQRALVENPPFEGEWAMFSWSPLDWRATSDITTGSNLWGYVRSFADRFRSGR